MNGEITEEESTVLNYIKDFFISYDKNRHLLHTLFTIDGTFIILGNRVEGHANIQQAMMLMATTTHRVISINLNVLPLTLPQNVTMYQVFCAGIIEFGGDPSKYGFTAAFLVSYQQPNNVLNVLSFSERCQWSKLF